MTITVTTANICGNPIRPRPVVRGRMSQALSIPGVTFGQECAASNHFRVPPRGNYAHAWANVSRAFSKIPEGAPQEVPISLPKDYPIESSQVMLMHTGKKFISPNRYATIIKTTVDGMKVAFVNCHTVSQPRLTVAFGRWRVRMFKLYIAKLFSVIEGLHGEGYTVVFGGDMNHGAPLHVHPAQEVLVASGLDHLWVVPAAGMAVSGVTTRKIPRTVLMDHPILSATFNLHAA